MTRADPIPPPAPRTDPVGWLRREIWLARNAKEHHLAGVLQRRLTTLLDARPEDLAAAAPARETTSRARPRRPHVPRQ